MISKLAKSTIQKWTEEEGLKPSMEDIILLNALGCRVENGQDACSFGNVPRCAFLGDYTLWEPTIRKKIWMDEARQLVSDNFFTQLSFTAFVLHTPVSELPDLKNVQNLRNAVSKFVEEVLIDKTETQIFAAVQYVMTGNDWRVGENYTLEEKKAFKSVYDLPQETYSGAKYLLNEALSLGMHSDVADNTIDEVQRLLIVAAIHDGADVLKNQHAQDAGAFYAASQNIHKRLIEEKQKEDLNKEKENGEE